MSTRGTTVAALAVALALSLLAPTSPSGATTAPASAPRAETEPNPADPANPDNPLAGREWGTYKGNADPAWPPYQDAVGETKQQLARIALTPKAKFFGSWISDDGIRSNVNDYVENASGGDPDVLVQLTLFRMKPWGREACQREPTEEEQLSYRRYVRRFATAIGDQPAAVVVQPDGPFARCAPIYRELLGRAVKQLENQPNTSAYLEMGSADWFRDDIRDPVRTLLQEGVENARGFALNTSHFDSVARQIRFGSRIVDALAERGVPDVHFVIDTSDNGRPFTGEWWHDTHGDDVPLAKSQACQSLAERRCVTLGPEPTTQVAHESWGLGDTAGALAAEHVDAYLWVSRPWLHEQSGPFDLERALDIVASAPYPPLD